MTAAAGRNVNRIACAAVAGALLTWTGCASTAGSPNAEAQIRRLDAEWSQAAQAHDVDRVLAFWAEDAVVFPPGSAAVVGKAAIREYVTKSFATPGFTISWKTTSVALARSGDFAYTTDTNRVTFGMPDGKTATVDGKGVAVWRLERDGGWKCVIDIWNDTAPPQ